MSPILFLKAKCIDQEVTEILEYTPGAFYVRRIVRKKYALAQEQGIIIADLPTLPLPKSNAGASLLAHLLVSKYIDHLPFYRQIEIFNRINIHLVASTIIGWFSASVDLLELLYQELRQQVMESDYIQIDETSIPVVDKDKPGPQKRLTIGLCVPQSEKCFLFITTKVKAYIGLQ